MKGSVALCLVDLAWLLDQRDELLMQAYGSHCCLRRQAVCSGPCAAGLAQTCQWCRLLICCWLVGGAPVEGSVKG